MTDSNPTFCVDCGVMTYLEEGRGWRCVNCSSNIIEKSLWEKPKKPKDDAKDDE